MRSLSVISLFLLLLSAETGGLSAEPSVTEEVFLAAVDAAHPAYRSLVGELGAAEANLLRSKLLKDPFLEVEREKLEDLEKETLWGVSWTPPIDRRRRQAIRGAEAGVEVAQSQLAANLLDLHHLVRRAYADWAANEARLALLVNHSQRLEKLAQRMQHRADAGEESLLDAQRLRIAFESAKTELSQARAEAAASRTQAAVWLVDPKLDLATARPLKPDLHPIPKDLDVTLRPDLRALDSRIDQAEALQQLSQRVAEAPQVTLGWKSLETDTRDLRGSVIALNWKLPFFDRQQADQLAAETALEVANARKEWASKRAASDLAAAVAAYAELRQSALSSQAVFATLDHMTAAVSTTYLEGENSVTDLLESLRAVLQAQLSSTNLYFAALEAHRQLELAAGQPLIFGATS